MKYIVMLGDGMADYPVQELGNRTPLQAAHKPNIDRLAPYGICGMVKTVPDDMKPGSDVANLSAMGYNPQECYTGRSPLEAVSIGIQMSDTDVAYRCNLVTLSEEEDYSQKIMLDYSADEITTKEAEELMKAVNKAFETEKIRFYAGISYRHCMIWKHGPLMLNLTPPHDISDRRITNYLPENEQIYQLMQKSYEVLKNHPINQSRISRGLHPANSIWLWGEGTRPKISGFKEKYGLSASVISAVDLIKGIGICAGMKVIEVKGATGNIDTNFEGKGLAALNTLLEGQDLVYIHVEAPDECGHRGEVENKVKAIELIDEKIVGPLVKGLEDAGEDFSILIMPDHPTPLQIKTHTKDPVPYLIYTSNDIRESGIKQYDEESCKTTGNYLEQGYQLMGILCRNQPLPD